MKAEEWITALYAEEIYQLPPPTTLIVLPVPWTELTDDDRLMLRRLLKAVGTGLVKARIIHTQELTEPMLEAIDAKYAIVFGVDVDPPVNNYEIVQIGRTSLVRTFAPSQLTESLKRPLWDALQDMYGLPKSR